MLKAVRSARPGDFITVADLTGRITEMGLLHTEVQTEFRDLVTVPNMYMVTQPMQVVRASGTIIPRGDTRFEQDDRLTIIGMPKAIRTLTETYMGQA